MKKTEEEEFKREDWMTAGEAAIELGVSRNVITRYIADEKVTCFRDTADRRIVWILRADILKLKKRALSKQPISTTGAHHKSASKKPARSHALSAK